MLSSTPIKSSLQVLFSTVVNINSFANILSFFQEALDCRARDAEAEVKHLTEKYSASELLVTEMTTKLADADKLSRSLRAVLREKEDAVVALESGLALKQQEVQSLMNALMFYYVSPSIITFFMPWY